MGAVHPAHTFLFFFTTLKGRCFQCVQDISEKRVTRAEARALRPHVSAAARTGGVGGGDDDKEDDEIGGDDEDGSEVDDTNSEEQVAVTEEG